MISTRPKSAAELLGRPPAPKTGRERLLAAAIELFYRNGFGAVGIDRVIAEAGVTKTTFYKHFDGKDDLMVAAVKMRDEWESQAWAGAVRKMAGDDPVAQLLGMLDVMDIWFNDPEFLGCLFLNTAAEFPNPNDPVHQAAAAYKRKTRDNFRNLARAAGADSATAETFADCYAALFEGRSSSVRRMAATTPPARSGRRSSRSSPPTWSGPRSNLESRTLNRRTASAQSPVGTIPAPSTIRITVFSSARGRCITPWARQTPSPA
jgi:AcrR family transcriptional regulator